MRFLVTTEQAINKFLTVLAYVRTPFFTFAAVVAFTIFCVAATLFAVINTPWLGVKLSTGEGNSVVIHSVAVGGPFQDIATWTKIISFGADGMPEQRVTPKDIIAEPDTLPTVEQWKEFKRNQAALFEIVSRETFFATIAPPNAEVKRVSISPSDKRPIVDLPIELWLQIVIATFGALIGGWVLAFRLNENSARFFAICCLGSLGSILSGSVYNSRELTIDVGLYEFLSTVNSATTLIFAAALVSLITIYPKRIFNHYAIIAVWAVALIVWLLYKFSLLSSLYLYGYLTFLYALTVPLMVGQAILARTDPMARVILYWIAFSFFLGMIFFMLVSALPIIFGGNVLVPNAYLSLIFIPIFLGLAVGIGRYRLFDIDVWAFRLLSYFAGGLALLSIDAFLLYIVSFERLPAFGIALVLVGLVYLPLRNWLGNVLFKKHTISQLEFRQIIDLANLRSKSEQQEAWQKLMERQFQPLETSMRSDECFTQAEILDNGLSLYVPAVEGLRALELRFANLGKSLFGPRHLSQVQDMVALTKNALQSRQAFAQGVSEERTRIAQDLHDNIGAQLLRTLHIENPVRKDELIADTITDLKDIVLNAQGEGINLSQMWAQLRFESAERLDDHHIDMSWKTDVDDMCFLDAKPAHNLRSILREALSNVIRHSKAKNVDVSLAHANGKLDLIVADDGVGFMNHESIGHGIANIKLRAEQLGGEVVFSAPSTGTKLYVSLPLKGENE
ncbi:ATP-binding protein [Maritalea sp.]|uniref:sensor histidine kinase n=1 Tax=Maritalea sp. TaxID=2003361 RepID=UPI003EF8CFB5